MSSGKKLATLREIPAFTAHDGYVIVFFFQPTSVFRMDFDSDGTSSDHGLHVPLYVLHEYMQINLEHQLYKMKNGDNDKSTGQCP